MSQQRFIFSDGADAIGCWRGYEWKKWAVDITAGPAKCPTYRYTMYIRARDAAGAVECAKRHATKKPPRGARWVARLAGPRELGCEWTPATKK